MDSLPCYWSYGDLPQNLNINYTLTAFWGKVLFIKPLNILIIFEKLCTVPCSIFSLQYDDDDDMTSVFNYYHFVKLYALEIAYVGEEVRRKLTGDSSLCSSWCRLQGLISSCQAHVASAFTSWTTMSSHPFINTTYRGAFYRVMLDWNDLI